MMTASVTWRDGALTKIRRVALASVVFFSALLAGCQHLPGRENPADTAAKLTAELAPPPERTWPDPKQDVLNQRARGFGLVRMPEMQQYLDGLLTRIKKQAGVPEWPGKVYVLASPSLEAYATAAGNIYVSQSWLSSMESEDEVVALLSHEFGHVYLHYHQLEGAVSAGNTAANVSVIAVKLVTKGAQATGWGAADGLAVGYMAGRDLLSSAWGRSQESAADTFGMNISIKMGYSYEPGFKTFFERIATWEEESDKRKEVVAQALLAQVRADAAQAIRAQNETPNSEVTKAMYEPLAQLSSAISGIFHQGSTGVSSLWTRSTASHPDTLSRMDLLAAAVDVMPPESLPDGEAKTAPWKKTLAQRRTAQILSNYGAAKRAMENQEDPSALRDAQTGTKGVTSTHAFPLHVLHQVMRARAAKQASGRRGDSAAVLDRNLNSEGDRAWLAYVERAQQLREVGRGRDAQAVMNSGFTYFNSAGNAWPQAILFYGETKGWDTAKQLAATCQQRFPTMADACIKAAASPADRAETERRTKAKAEQLVNKLMGK